MVDSAIMHNPPRRSADLARCPRPAIVTQRDWRSRGVSVLIAESARKMISYSWRSRRGQIVQFGVSRLSRFEPGQPGELRLA
jgi:hypothetical protein